MKPPDRMNLHQCNLSTQAIDPEEYDSKYARVIASHMCNLDVAVLNTKHKHPAFVTTFGLGKGIQKFGDKGCQAAVAEMSQLHDRKVLAPIRFDSMTSRKRQKVTESLVFITEKRDSKVKARTVANGNNQQPFVRKGDTASPTVLVESVMMTGTIEAKE